MVGPGQVPVADCAVTLSDYLGFAGEAMARGDRSPLAAIDRIVRYIEDGKIREARNFSFDQAAADAFFWQAYPMKPLPERLAN